MSNETTSPYRARGGMVYETQLGEEVPLTFFMATQKLSRHRHNATFYAGSDPARAQTETALGDDLEEVIEAARDQA